MRTFIEIKLRRDLRRLVVAVVAMGLIAGIRPSETCSQTIAAGSSSRKLRQQAQELVPFEMLNEQTRLSLKPVLEKPSIYRRLPVTGIQADPDYYRFLVRHPEVVVNIWKLMGVTKMEAKRSGPFEIQSNDGAGTISELELVYGDRNTHIFFGTGSYEGSLLRRKLTGSCVLILKTIHDQDPQGQPRAVSQLDVFLKVDNTTVGMIARTLQPIVGPTADHNFTESLKFIQRLNETTVRNGPGVQGMAEQLEISQAVRERFQQAAGLVHQRHLISQRSLPTNESGAAVSVHTQAENHARSGSPSLNGNRAASQTTETSQVSWKR